MSFADERLRELCQQLGLDALGNDFPGLADVSDGLKIRTFDGLKFPTP
jgi:hypothetical protein